MSDITDKIRSKGYWSISIRPEVFIGDRVDYADLEELLTKAAVRLRGWPVPFIDYGSQTLRGDDWIGQDIDGEVVSFYEAWRFFTSGQFTQLRSVSADWRVGVEATRIPEGSDSVIEIWEILFYITEVFELAARLSLTRAGSEGMTIDICLEGMQGRALVVGQPGRVPFVTAPRANLPHLERSVTVNRDLLIAEARRQAVELAREFFLRFGWQPSVEQLLRHQQELAST